MLMPIPNGGPPVTAQHDAFKTRGDIVPVVPVLPPQEVGNDTEVELERRHAEELEEQKRRQEQQQQQQARPEPVLAEGEIAIDDLAPLEEEQRQGVFVDVEV
jgi:hypothetical protein